MADAGVTIPSKRACTELACRVHGSSATSKAFGLRTKKMAGGGKLEGERRQALLQSERKRIGRTFNLPQPAKLYHQRK